MRTKPLHKLESQGVIRLFKGKKLCFSIINPFGYFKIHGFHGNPLYDFKDWEHSYKNIHISAASHPRAHNLLSY